MVRFLLCDAVDLTVSLRQGPPKPPGKASGRFDRGLLFEVQILQGEDRGHDGDRLQPIHRSDAKNPLPTPGT
jgi:hypothetical protein